MPVGIKGLVLLINNADFGDTTDKMVNLNCVFILFHLINISKKSS